MLRWPIRFLTYGVLALAALVLAHDLAFLVKYGPAYSHALAVTGHDDRWTAAMLAVAVVSAALLGAASWRLYRLRREAANAVALLSRSAIRSTHARVRSAAGLPAPRALGALLLPRWGALAAVVLVLFTIQENIEQASRGLALPGPGVLIANGDLRVLPIVALAALAVGFVVALFSWHRLSLQARIAAARATRRPAPREDRPRPFPADRRPASVLGRRQGLRAPPAFLPA